MLVIQFAPTRYTSAGAIEAAWCEVDGKRFEAESGTGAVHALCRALRDAGIPDQEWHVPGRLYGLSIHGMADWSVSREGRLTKFRPFPVSGEGKSGEPDDPDAHAPAEQTAGPFW